MNGPVLSAPLPCFRQTEQVSSGSPVLTTVVDTYQPTLKFGSVLTFCLARRNSPPRHRAICRGPEATDYRPGHSRTRLREKRGEASPPEPLAGPRAPGGRLFCQNCAVTAEGKPQGGLRRACRAHGARGRPFRWPRYGSGGVRWSSAFYVVFGDPPCRGIPPSAMTPNYRQHRADRLPPFPILFRQVRVHAVDVADRGGARLEGARGRASAFIISFGTLNAQGGRD